MPFKVRFAAVKVGDSTQPSATASQALPSPDNSGRRQPKSHHGCRECKIRRVKCDETLPTCIRCKKRGSICHSVTRPSTWQVEIPWLPTPSPQACLDLVTLDQQAHVNTKLLSRWFERTAYIIVLDPEKNPLSFPIINQLEASSSLIHALQSICAGHETFFEHPEQGLCLQERGKALQTFRQELARGQIPQTLTFWTCYLLGVSSSYIGHEQLDYGKEHLFAAHEIVASILADVRARDTEPVKQILGAYAYWDFSCSMLIDPAEQPPRDPVVLESIAQMMATFDHCITGRFTDLFWFLGGLGRYCRRVADGFTRDRAVEEDLERKLVNWDTSSSEEQWTKTGNMFRTHGLILLYRICGSLSGLKDHGEEQNEGEIMECADEVKVKVHALSLYAINTALEIPSTSTFVCVQGHALLSAASELTAQDAELRGSVRVRLREIFSYNHLPGSIRALTFLESVWALRDAGSDAHWLRLMLEKMWRLRLE